MLAVLCTERCILSSSQNRASLLEMFSKYAFETVEPRRIGLVHLEWRVKYKPDWI